MAKPSEFMVIENGFVTIRVKPGYNYEIDLDSINTLDDLMRWKHHLSEKRWMNPKSLEYFVSLVAMHKPIKCPPPHPPSTRDGSPHWQGG